jgi:hypothetical protein
VTVQGTVVRYKGNQNTTNGLGVMPLPEREKAPESVLESEVSAVRITAGVHAFPHALGAPAYQRRAR